MLKQEKTHFYIAQMQKCGVLIAFIHMYVLTHILTYTNNDKLH